MKQQTEIAELKRKLEHMNEVFANAQRARFGQSSEKNTYVLHEQLGLFNEAEQEQNHNAAEPTEETFTVNAHQRRLGELTQNLSVKEVLLELEESQLVCDKCGGMMKPIGKKFVRHELEIIPKQVILKAICAATYACNRCEKGTGFSYVVSVKPPVPLMKHSLASASTVADVMTKKYVDGLPLARQEKIWAREGGELGRATLANWVIQCSQTWLLCHSVTGTQFSVIVYSLVETARVNGLGTYKYLRYILEELPYLERSPAHKDLEALMPWDPYILHA